MKKLRATKLTRTLKTKDGGSLSNLAEAAAFMLELQEGQQAQRAWQHVLELIRDEAKPEELTLQINLALLLSGQLGFE